MLVLEKALIDLGYDDVLDDYVLTSKISEVTSIDLFDRNISDMQGIGDFSNLRTLDCSNNVISNLDLTGNLKLNKLICATNTNTINAIYDFIALDFGF